MSELDEVVNEFNNLNLELANVTKKFREKAKVLLSAKMKEFFKDHPNVEWIGWTQYTPYFNDGDECIFRVNDLHFGYENPEDVYSPYDGVCVGYSKVYGYENPDGRTFEEVYKDFNAVKDVERTLFSIGEDTFKVLFGDHKFIRISKAGIDILDYDHD